MNHEGTDMNETTTSLFHPARMPARDPHGCVEHPDFDQFEMRDGEDSRSIDPRVFRDEGLQIRATYGDGSGTVEDGRGNAEEGWRLACVWLLEGAHVAIYVRPLPAAVLNDLRRLDLILSREGGE